MAEKKTEDKAEGKGGGKTKLLLILGVVALLAGVGVGAYLMGAGSAASKEGAAEAQGEKAAGGHGEKAPAKHGEAAGAPEAAVPTVGPMVAMEDFIVNITDADGTRYLKASMTLELATPEGLTEVEERKAQVRDTILLYLSSKTFEEIRDLQGKLQLRADLIGKLNALLEKGKIKTIYFTDFVVQ